MSVDLLGLEARDCIFAFCLKDDDGNRTVLETESDFKTCLTDSNERYCKFLLVFDVNHCLKYKFSYYYGVCRFIISHDYSFFVQNSGDSAKICNIHSTLFDRIIEP